MAAYELVADPATPERGTLRITNEVAGRARTGAADRSVLPNSHWRVPPMTPPHRFTLFCGIDVAKAAHVACLLDSNGQFLFCSQTFANTAEGFARLLDRLQQAAGNQGVLVGM